MSSNHVLSAAAAAAAMYGRHLVFKTLLLPVAAAACALSLSRYLNCLMKVYFFCDLIRQDHPEKSYTSLRTTIFLPANGQGRAVHRLMQPAFDARQLFKVDYKGSEIGKLVSNGVDFKTSM
jgi:Deltex C-terminal domain